MLLLFLYNLRSLTVRKTTSLLTAGGMALVVFVIAAALMLSQGIERTIRASGHDDVAIVLRKGAMGSEIGSIIEDSLVQYVYGMPGVRQKNGAPLGESDVAGVIILRRKDSDMVGNVMLRGVDSMTSPLRPEVRVVSGRLPRPGALEAMVGVRLRGRFAGVDKGGTFELKKNLPIDVVGVFSADGATYESEVWLDREILRGAFQRQGRVSGVRVKLESPNEFRRFKERVEENKKLHLEVFRESEFFQRQSGGSAEFVQTMGSFVAFFLSLGAMIGAMTTMYAAVANRRREIGILRALGFPQVGILLSFLLESLAIATAGGLVGAIVAVCMVYVKISMMNDATASDMVFTFVPTPEIVGIALGFMFAMGLVGGLLPAIRAARTSPLEAMRG